jgi:ubiquinone/menaquinone biosynthesis C-methylase UbiE
MQATHPAAPAAELPAPPKQKRFLSDQPGDYRHYIQMAEDYIGLACRKNEAWVKRWLYLKPYDPAPGNAAFYRGMASVLNVMQALNLHAGASILEVGSGPGWMTEILLCMGYRVYALEPAASMIEVARDRLALCAEHHRMPTPIPVTFACEPLEECSAPDASMDAVIFHETLHHVIDEDKALAQAFRVLRPDGTLGVCGEMLWLPGDRTQERVLREEMALYGALENPFTYEYLHHLLVKHGFQDIVRYHAVNGYFPESMGGVPIREAAQDPAHLWNHLTARKPVPGGRTSACPDGTVTARVTASPPRWDAEARTLTVDLKLTNTGDLAWLRGPRDTAYVTVSLFRGTLGGADFRESRNRVHLTKSVMPGETLELPATFTLPADVPPDGWKIDLINEGHFWFLTQPGAGTPTVLPDPN